ncbi:MAG: hypothetical protein CM15mP23_18480 [Cryomorphaceae bacterium]|nr:MAG: hypothetical protein CM15mP23_18480 [Cryomorphaceae bacterium]
MLIDYHPVGDVQIDVNTTNNDLCEYYGCTYPEMFNYDSLANVDDGTCIPVVIGCMDDSTPACNFNSLANTPDSTSCEYPTVNYNCDGNCLNDSDGDSVCDEEEVPGCIDILLVIMMRPLQMMMAHVNMLKIIMIVMVIVF